MKTRTAKTTFLFSLYIAAHFLEACQVFGPICDCPDVNFPYFDYKNMVVYASAPSVDSNFELIISPDSIEFVAQATPHFQFISSAYGCSCNVDGDEGDKYAPVSMDIFADRDFNDTLPAGVSLNPIFYGRKGDVVQMLTPQFAPGKFNYWDQRFQVTTNAYPKQLGVPYHFQIQWVKSNGDTLRAQSDDVIFY